MLICLGVQSLSTWLNTGDLAVPLTRETEYTRGIYPIADLSTASWLSAVVCFVKMGMPEGWYFEIHIDRCLGA
jgi:hypothetical protein